MVNQQPTDGIGKTFLSRDEVALAIVFDPAIRRIPRLDFYRIAFCAIHRRFSALLLRIRADNR
jgi:hypothetical protein